MATIPSDQLQKYVTLDGAIAALPLYHATEWEAFGPAIPLWDAAIVKFDPALVGPAFGKLQLAAATNDSAILTVSELHAVNIALAMGACALAASWDGKRPAIPVHPWSPYFRRAAEASNAIVDPRSNQGAIVLDPFGHSHPDPVIAKTLARLCAAIVALGKSPETTKIAPSIPSLPVPSEMVPTAAGAVLAGIAIVAAAAVAGVYLWRKAASDEAIGKRKVEVDANTARLAEDARVKMQAGIARLDLQAKTGQTYDPLPIETQTAPELEKASDGRGGSMLALGAGLLLGAGGAVYALKKWGGGA